MDSASHTQAKQAERARKPLSAIMSTPARCVTPETPLATLSNLLLHSGISAAPVVDANGKAIGVVSKTDILRHVDWEAGPGPRSSAALTVGDAMTELVVCLEADAAISRASALMAYEGVHRIVVTAADGKAIGVVSALDVLRWLATEDGYVMAPPARKGE